MTIITISSFQLSSQISFPVSAKKAPKSFFFPVQWFIFPFAPKAGNPNVRSPTSSKSKIYVVMMPRQANRCRLSKKLPFDSIFFVCCLVCAGRHYPLNCRKLYIRNCNYFNKKLNDWLKICLTTSQSVLNSLSIGILFPCLRVYIQYLVQ